MVRNDFSLWIESERKARGWSRSELARRTGYSAIHISRVERDLSGVSADFCVALAKALNADPVETMKMAGIVGQTIPNEPRTLTDQEQAIIDDLRSLNYTDREKLVDFAKYLIHARASPALSPQKEKAIA